MKNSTSQSTTGEISEENLPEDFYRLYPGGKSLAGYILLNEIPAHTEPFSPENVLVMANGLLTGAPVLLPRAMLFQRVRH